MTLLCQSSTTRSSQSAVQYSYLNQNYVDTDLPKKPKIGIREDLGAGHVFLRLGNNGDDVLHRDGIRSYPPCTHTHTHKHTHAHTPLFDIEHALEQKVHCTVKQRREREEGEPKGGWTKMFRHKSKIWETGTVPILLAHRSGSLCAACDVFKIMKEGGTKVSLAETDERHAPVLTCFFFSSPSSFAPSPPFRNARLLLDSMCPFSLILLF